MCFWKFLVYSWVIWYSWVDESLDDKKVVVIDESTLTMNSHIFFKTKMGHPLIKQEAHEASIEVTKYHIAAYIEYPHYIATNDNGWFSNDDVWTWDGRLLRCAITQYPHSGALAPCGPAMRLIWSLPEDPDRDRTQMSWAKLKLWNFGNSRVPLRRNEEACWKSWVNHRRTEF